MGPVGRPAGRDRKAGVARGAVRPVEVAPVCVSSKGSFPSKVNEPRIKTPIISIYQI